MADGEPATPVLMTAVKLAVPEETVKPRFYSKCKGLVENAHQLVQGVLRIWVASTENKYHTTLSPSSPSVQWRVRHSGFRLTRCTILEDGLIPYRGPRGRANGGAIAELGETVLFHVQGFKRWGGKNLWMDNMSSTDEHIVGTTAGRQQACTLTRRRESEALIAQVVCTPLESKLSLLPAVQAQRQFCLTRGGGKVWTHGWVQSVRLKEWLAHLRAETGWKKNKHVRERLRKPRTKHSCQTQTCGRSRQGHAPCLKVHRRQRRRRSRMRDKCPQPRRKCPAGAQASNASKRENLESLETWERLTWMSKEKTRK